MELRVLHLFAILAASHLVFGAGGNGQTCRPIYTDCYHAFTEDNKVDGIYLIKPANWKGKAFDVPCVMSGDGGWTVFQRRTGTDCETNFYRDWKAYRNGFGSLSRDFWLGNEQLHYLTQQGTYTLRVDAVPGENEPMTGVEWSVFSIGTEEDDYRISLGGYDGTWNSDLVWHNGSAFSTYDRDNDGCGAFNCAEKHRSGWWYWRENVCGHANTHNTCNCFCFLHNTGETRCTHSNPNGMYGGKQGETPFWGMIEGEFNCDLISIEMKIRPAN